MAKKNQPNTDGCLEELVINISKKLRDFEWAKQPNWRYKHVVGINWHQILVILQKLHQKSNYKVQFMWKK